MTPITATLVLALSIAAPAPKGDKGLPKDLIDLLPEDANAVMVVDVLKAGKCELGKTVLKVIAAEQAADDPIKLADIVRDAELALGAQFLIDKQFGDFCFIVRLKEGSDLPKDLIAKATKVGKDSAPQEIGKRTVYSIDSAHFSFAVIDNRTLMFVLASGDAKQLKETRQAAYGERDKPGPSAGLRKMIEADTKDNRALRVYGLHPTKLPLSLSLFLAPYGVKDKPVASLGDKLVSFRGGIREGEAGDVEFHITMKNADAAKEMLKVYEDSDEKEPFVLEFRATTNAVRDGDDVVLTSKLTQAMIQMLATKPNK